MCGIAGFCNPKTNFTTEESKWSEILLKMNHTLKHRGPDDDGYYLKDGCGLSHVRLRVLDLVTGHQPLVRVRNGRSCVIVYNGNVYNMHELKKELVKEGESFVTTSDTEVVLAGYMTEGIDFIKKLNGVFSFAIWDESQKRLYLCRDQIGIKPLFYTWVDGTLIFSSELKGLFEYPLFQPEIDKESMREIFALGPAKTPGKGVFKNVYEVLSGNYMIYDTSGVKTVTYWKLESKPHTDSFQETIEKTSKLLYDAVKLQMMSDVPISTFLSGGVDSSLITAICAKELAKDGKILNTFSFDFEGNDMYYKSNAFQPSRDRPFVDKMVDFSNTNHQYLECDNMELADYLYEAVDARDLPCMADVESSLLYFCKKVVKYNKVALSGECADEIFLGYPWFHKQETFDIHGFPWSYNMEPRRELLNEDFARELHMEEYSRAAYEATIAKTPYLEGENSTERRRREIAYLNLKWFMMTLVDRMDRTSMYAGLEARVPFADRRIVSYVFNVPWEMKCPDGIVKGLLRKAGEAYLLHDILYRKKSPYPKTYHPGYEAEIAKRLREVLGDSNAPIKAIIDAKKVEHFLSQPLDYGKPWYGQLMAGPQMLAYLLQVNYWMKKYHLSV